MIDRLIIFALDVIQVILVTIWLIILLPLILNFGVAMFG